MAPARDEFQSTILVIIFPELHKRRQELRTKASRLKVQGSQRAKMKIFYVFGLARFPQELRF